MNGLDFVREEMERRGYSKSQIESKTAAVVVDILTEGRANYLEMVDNESAETRRLESLHHQIREAERTVSWYNATIENLKMKYKGVVAQAEEAQKYIADFNLALLECETDEGRDAMRRAQVFINSVNVDTKYDNTAYIIGLAAILSDGKCGAIEELHKINPKIDIEEHAEQPRRRLRLY